MPPDVRRAVVRDLADGWSHRDVASRRKVSRQAVDAVARGVRSSAGVEWREKRLEEELREPIPLGELTDVAAEALDDIILFGRRCFGAVLLPWQAEAAEKIATLLDSPHDEYAVVNAPPGSGKSFFFTRILLAWLTVKNRAVRGLIGSATDSTATWYTRQLKLEFERVLPRKAEFKELRDGRAIDAETTLAREYGLFKPATNTDIWRAAEFTVAQHGNVAARDKESTWTAVGRDSNFLGGRFDFVIFDDLWNPDKLRSADVREDLKRWYTQVSEARLEPGGLLILQGQRFGPDDIYRFALDMVAGDPDEDEDETVALEVRDDARRKYHHLCWQAHYDDRCELDHRRAAPAYPEGCLLSPRRVGWRRLSAVRENRPEEYEVVYQQHDVDPAGVLVPMLWVEGGRDEDGTEYPGCWDRNRDLCELPRGLSGHLLSIATADPSPTENWAIQWWVVAVESEQRFLMDTYKGKLEAPEFLDWDYDNHEFIGKMETWQARSAALGVPISHWIVERNAAQRFLLQYDHVRRWQRKRGVDIIGHDTNRNKADPDYGVETIAPHWRWGRVRLPGKQWIGDSRTRSSARFTSLRLVEEVTTYPTGKVKATKDDQVMANWFLEYNLPNLYDPQAGHPAHSWRPSWLRRAS